MRGSSALRCGALPFFSPDESAEALGVSRGSLMRDFAEFYDALGPILAQESALALDFPATSAGLSPTLYVPPRCVKTRGAASRPVEPTASILMGDGDADNFARAVLYGALGRPRANSSLEARPRRSGLM